MKNKKILNGNMFTIEENNILQNAFNIKLTLDETKQILEDTTIILDNYTIDCLKDDYIYIEEKVNEIEKILKIK